MNQRPDAMAAPYAELRFADASQSPLVDEARRRLLDMISSGALRPGDKLGTERDLAARLSVSRSTLRQVLALLAQAGVVRRVPGRSGGTFVARAKLDRDLSVIVGLPEYLRRQGFVAGTQVLSATMTSADELTAAHLELHPKGLIPVNKMIPAGPASGGRSEDLDRKREHRGRGLGPWQDEVGLLLE